MKRAFIRELEFLIKRTLEKFRIHLFRFRIKSEETIIIAGSPRSGTTWVMELLRYIRKYLSLWEPFNKVIFPKVIPLGFPIKPYINTEKDNKELENYFINLFNGKYYSQQPHFKIREYFKRCLATGLILKFTRANRILHWIYNRFTIRGTLLIVRHPCATILSQINSQNTGYMRQIPKKEKMIREMKVIDIIPKKIKEKLSEHLNSKEEILTLSWALDIFIPLYFIKQFKFNIIFYEDLVINSRRELYNIFKYLGFNLIPLNIFKNIRIPSFQAKEGYYSTNPEKQLSKWKDLLTEKQVEKILSILSIFHFDFYSHEILPNHKKLENWKSPF